MGKVIIFAAEGVQDEEFFVPYYRFKEEFDVYVVTLDGNNFKGKYGIPFKGVCHRLDSHLDLDSNPEAFYISPNISNITSEDILYIPGGYQCPELLRQSSMVLSCVQEMYDMGCLITSICHGPQVIISAGIARGKQMTCYKGMKDDLINADMNYQDKRVVVDDNVITAQHYNDLPEFHKTVIQHYHLRNSVIH